MSKEKVIEIARGELGVTEFPAGSNCVKYWSDYTGIGPSMQGQPWCVCFLWWCFWKAGESSAFFGGEQTASCGTLLRWYKEQGLTVPVEDVQVGDIVLLNFNGKGTPDHCGLVVEVKHPYIGALPEVKTIEGNTSPGEEGSQDNGGCVALKRRLSRNIVGAARPKYKPDDPQPVDDVTGHWAERSIRRAIKRGIMQGYPDGSFKPNQAVTRAELAVILDRLEET